MLKNVAGWILCGVFLIGCTTTYGTRQIEEVPVFLQKKVTTKDQVVARFGPPKDIAHLEGGGETFLYERVREWLKRYLGFVASNILQKTTKRLLITFDVDGIVTDYKVDELYSEETVYLRNGSNARAIPSQSYQASAQNFQNSIPSYGTRNK